ncbi:hypothetical protein AORI_4453 [Amycolatopsis keratiniphila]|uniref:Uncharacterized protein n=1 Tax=Amycolatopsis keratiniphila TaxID=129921 RepID=R4T907_9PSEU|nr:hypothetical protein AORI_4453 [Amycolatopsis keratiniphila]
MDGSRKSISGRSIVDFTHREDRGPPGALTARRPTLSIGHRRDVSSHHVGVTTAPRPEPDE